MSPDAAACRDRLRAHVRMLSETIGARSTSAPAGLVRAASYVAAELRRGGREVVREAFRADGMTCENLVVERRGALTPREVVVVGAHYDGVLEKPAANDNATGTAALIELAARFAGETTRRTLRFVAFTNEEPHHFQTSSMGSLVNARRARARGDDIVAMLSLESLGRYDTRAGSQNYPPPLSLFYPDRGDFIAFIGRSEHVGLVRRAIGAFRTGARFPSEGAALSATVPGVRWSDHWSYSQAGYPAIMVTDSAPYRDRNYHTHRDTWDRVDYDRMTRVVEGMVPVIRALANDARRYVE